MITVKMKPNFMLWGTTTTLTPSTVGVLNVPYPDTNGFGTSQKVQAQAAADGSTVLQVVGRTKAQFNIGWTVMDCTTWWQIVNWLDANGPVFYCKYFDYNRGTWATHKFYASDPQCSPFRPNSNATATNWGKPSFLRNCKITITDLGGE